MFQIIFFSNIVEIEYIHINVSLKTGAVTVECPFPGCKTISSSLVSNLCPLFEFFKLCLNDFMILQVQVDKD